MLLGGDRRAGRTTSWQSPRFWLLIVCLAFVLAQVGLVRNLGLGWDESIYASQTDPRRPALVFSAPRARPIELTLAQGSEENEPC